MKSDINMLIKITAYWRLGIANLWRVFWYLMRLKTGSLKRELPVGESVEGIFFEPADFTKAKLQLRQSVLSHSDETKLFGWYPLSLETPPDWHRSVLTKKSLGNQHEHWTQVSDFASGVGDIKGIWEPSRFTWSLNLASNYIVSRDPSDLDKLNVWLNVWSRHNPQNSGANWKCAQETSFRVIHLAACALLLEQRTPTQSMTVFVRQHLLRILPTLGYAKAQDNNHGTSEAAALVVGSSWLLQSSPEDQELLSWYRKGREYLTDRMERLVMSDGTFSQYSVNYHRVMLDTVSFVELWRRYLALPALPKSFGEQARKGTEWLFQFTDKQTGDAANLGANDGAHILNYLDSEYRDFRPCVELASILFCEKRAYEYSYHENLCKLFSMEECQPRLVSASSGILQAGGYAYLSNNRAGCFLRAAKFKFRPGQADLMHLDLWLDGKNLLRDGGSYSYNTENQWLEYFNGAEGHNTVQVDNRQSMPKISRFLYGCWPRYRHLSVTELDSSSKMSTSYTDWQGVLHQREVALAHDHLTVIDEVSNFKDIATVRWRLPSEDWILEENTLVSGNLKVEIFANVPVSRLTLANGYESRYYGQKQAIPVLEVEVAQDAQITTIIHWT